jgi:hypothetical protein
MRSRALYKCQKFLSEVVVRAASKLCLEAVSGLLRGFLRRVLQTGAERHTARGLVGYANLLPGSRSMPHVLCDQAAWHVP